MKKFFLSVMAMACALCASAQQTDMQMATLQHGDETTVFYGVDALVDAYNAAADTLDVITLSGGDFNVPSYISKSLAIYGNGAEPGISSGGVMTRLIDRAIYFWSEEITDESGNVVIRRPNGSHIEGLNIPNGIYVGKKWGNFSQDSKQYALNNLEIVKCYCSTFLTAVDFYECTIRQSHIYDLIATDSPTAKTIYARNFLISNCCFNYLYHFYWGDGYFPFTDNSTVHVDHCLILGNTAKGDGKQGTWDLSKANYHFTNNISYKSFAAGATSTNNIFLTAGNPSEDTFYNYTGFANEGIWVNEEEDGLYADEKDFRLKEPGRFVSSDGTEIGLHGGKYAWNKVPVIPRITECSIDTKDVVNGTLKVSIKAEAQTKE